MKEIILTQGKVALVDDEWYEMVNQFKWTAFKSGEQWYAVRGWKDDRILMHHFIMGKPEKLVVDHIDGNGLNNQKSNLRHCTHSQNHLNQGLQSNNTSGIKGVNFHKATNKWTAYIKVNGKKKHLGSFLTLEEAGKAREKAIKEVFGDFATSN